MRADVVGPRATVDVALVLAVDSSGSISEEQLRMQIQGYLDAISHPSFLEAVRGGRHGRVGLTFVTWTDARRQDQTVPWQVIEDEAGTHQFCQGVQGALRPVPGWTSISGAIDFCARLLLTSGYSAARRVIDISGDGANNDGRPVTEARDAGGSGCGHHHQRVADHRGRARPGEILSGERHRRSHSFVVVLRAIARHSARQSYANCWLRSRSHTH